MDFRVIYSVLRKVINYYVVINSEKETSSLKIIFLPSQLQDK
jgi:hypothetical protein